MSAINVVKEIAEKYKMEEKDYQWLKLIVEETISISEDYEKLQKAYDLTWDGIHNIINKYERRKK